MKGEYRPEELGRSADIGGPQHYPSAEYAMPPVPYIPRPGQQPIVHEQAASPKVPSEDVPLHQLAPRDQYRAALDRYDAVRAQPEFALSPVLLGQGKSAVVTRHGSLAVTTSSLPTYREREKDTRDRARHLSRGGQAVHPDLQQLVAVHPGKHEVISEVLPGTTPRDTPSEVLYSLGDTLPAILDMCETLYAADLALDDNPDNFLVSDRRVCVVDYEYDPLDREAPGALGSKIGAIALVLSGGIVAYHNLQYPHDDALLQPFRESAGQRLELLKELDALVTSRYAQSKQWEYYYAQSSIKNHIAGLTKMARYTPGR
jgi:hypothetical protein